MIETRDYDVIVDFWECYQRRETRQNNPLASYALDKCEEMFRECKPVGWVERSETHRLQLVGRISAT
jgi:hypothetical protein